MLTKGAQDNLGHMQLNKQVTLSCNNVLSLQERHQSSHNRGSVASQQVTQMFSSKNPEYSQEAHACSPYLPPTLCLSITFVMSLNDIRIICFPLLAGKPCTCTGEPCCLTCAPTSIPPLCSSTAMHRPSHQFCTPEFKPVTLSPSFFGAPSHWSLNFIKLTC